MDTQDQVAACGRGSPRCQEAAEAALLALAVELEGQAGWTARKWDHGEALGIQRAANLARERAGELAGDAPAAVPVASGAPNGSGPQEPSGRVWWALPR